MNRQAKGNLKTRFAQFAYRMLKRMGYRGWKLGGGGGGSRISATITTLLAERVQ